MYNVVEGCAADLKLPAVVNLTKLFMFKPDTQKITAFYQQFDFKQNQLFLAREKAKVIGVLFVTRQFGNHFVIKGIAVFPEKQSQGIGRSLLQAVKDIAPNCILEAETDDDAVDFYRSTGFIVESLGEKYPGIIRYRCIYQ